MLAYITQSVFILLFVSLTSANLKKHIFYWNTHMTPQLETNNLVLNVSIGQFMDILCPQRSLMGITNGPSKLSTFDLYNVTQHEFQHCKTGGKKNFIFACDRPEKENKLTMKFQRISPSPLGFRFQYCQDYYFLGTPRTTHAAAGCHKGVTRLRISVACKEDTTTTTTTTAKPTTTALPTTTTTTVSPKMKHSRRLKNAGLPRGKGLHKSTQQVNRLITILVPKVANVSKEEPQYPSPASSKFIPRILESSSGNMKSDNGHNAALSVFQRQSVYGIYVLFFSFLTFLNLAGHSC